MLLNDERCYWHQLDGIAFEFEYWKIWHFPTLLKWKHLLSWRLCYASISSRHVWTPQRDTVSVLPFSSKDSPSLTTCTPELKKLAGTCKFANEQLNVNLSIVLIVDCVHNMPSRNSCQETLHSKKPSCHRFSKRSKGHSRDEKSGQPAGDKKRCHRCGLTKITHRITADTKSSVTKRVICNRNVLTESSLLRCGRRDNVSVSPWLGEHGRRGSAWTGRTSSHHLMGNL